MLDKFTIATKGGIVLWSKDYAPISGQPLNSLVQEVLIQSSRTENTSRYVTGPYSLQWTFANELNVIFIAVYQKILQLPYLDDLLRHAKKHFVTRFREEIKSLTDPDCTVFPDFESFEEEFDQVWRAVEERDQRERQNRQAVPRKFEDTRKFQATAEGAKRELDELVQAGEMAPMLARKKETKMRSWSDKRQTPRSPASASGAEDEKTGARKGKKKGKQNRVWDGQVTKESMEALNYSGEKSDGGEDKRSVSALIDKKSMGARTADGIYEVADVAERANASGDSDSFVLLDDDDDDAGDAKNGSSATGGLFGMFRNLTSGRVLTAEILAEPMARMREHLANKNVAADIADEICQTVGKGMVGVRVGGLQNIRKLVEENMEKALTRILTPISSTDIIRDIEHARQQSRPYTMAFVGVNGVGKSTNLSKVCYWLLQNNKRVLIAACDTFRSGAVEQLRVHVRNLRALSENQNVEIFERGYGKDSASIAKDAIAFGASNGFDVVLIDTAGRMQDNEPLMRALAKLVSVNSPDKILFVGEALVGNEAVDQLEKFNQALRDFSGQSKPRHIDGIILTKFDTIDDRVGAALSMTYTTGQPIVFVGTGQTYTDLRKMNVSQVIRALLRA
ncbi:SRP54-domain-containing protein [Martensiomyces pterosporus]|nr:SRP54-domain-containing protein [Martensiomyces pterosporus]